MDTGSTPATSQRPDRCVLVIDSALPAGRAANAAAVLALTVGQRHPGFVGTPLMDANGVAHPGLIPVGIAVLAAEQPMLGAIRAKAVQAGCDVVDFPVQGQQTKDYETFIEAVAAVPTDALSYVGVALVGKRNAISKIVANLALLK